MSVWANSRKRRRGGVPYLGGFTLIEVLVVVAIIALLVAILLPSLSRARENARAVTCLSGIKQIASTTTMYTVDHKGRLPGPIHPSIYRFTDDFRIEQENPANSGKAIWSAFLPYYLRRYMTSSRTRTVDDTITCGTSEGIVPWKKSEVMASQPYRRPMQYIVNTTAANHSYWPNYKNPSSTSGERFPFIGTNPAYYFGRINVGDPFTNAVAQPKKIERIDMAAKEWLIADAWHYEVNGRPKGTWPYPISYASFSIKEGDRWFVPTWPFHQTTKRYNSPVNSQFTENNSNAPRFVEGRTNTGFFDGHAEGVRGWKGTTNACYADVPAHSNGCPE